MAIKTDMSLVSSSLWQPKLQNRFLLESFTNIREFDGLKMNLLSVNLVTSREVRSSTYQEDNPLELFRGFITELTLVFEDDVVGTVTRGLASISGNLDYDIVINCLDGRETVLQRINLLGCVFQSAEYNLDYRKSETAKYVVKFKTKLCSIDALVQPTETKEAPVQAAS